MDALFFLARNDEAVGVASSDDLPSEPIADALRFADPSPLAGLATVLGVEPRLRPLRDATCRSFPVWALGADLMRSLAALDDTGIDAAAERWAREHEASIDADLYELAECLMNLREAVRANDASQALFVLLEERAL